MEAKATAREEKFDPNCSNEVAEEDDYQPYSLEFDMSQILRAGRYDSATWEQVSELRKIKTSLNRVSTSLMNCHFE